MSEKYYLTDKNALRIGIKAWNSLRKDNRQANICLVNRFGEIVFKITMDDTRPFTAKVAENKAKQSAKTGERTRTLRDQVKTGEKTPQILDIDPKEFIPWAGGVPIYDQHNRLLGAIGISNLKEEDDEKFAIMAVEGANFISNRK